MTMILVWTTAIACNLPLGLIRPPPQSTSSPTATAAGSQPQAGARPTATTAAGQPQAGARTSSTSQPTPTSGSSQTAASESPAILARYSLDMAKGPLAVFATPEGIWVANSMGGSLDLFNPQDGHLVKTLQIGAAGHTYLVFRFAYDGSYLWVLSAETPMGGSQRILARVDLKTDDVKQLTLPQQRSDCDILGCDWSSLATSPGMVWIGSSGVTQIVDPNTMQFKDTIETGSVEEFQYDGQRMWLLQADDPNYLQVVNPKKLQALRPTTDCPNCAWIELVGSRLWTGVSIQNHTLAFNTASFTEDAKPVIDQTIAASISDAIFMLPIYDDHYIWDVWYPRDTLFYIDPTDGKLAGSFNIYTPEGQAWDKQATVVSAAFDGHNIWVIAGTEVTRELNQIRLPWAS
jgi:hypothetical protein